jgi:protein-L-isoaspartate(D-aspartate) O-methyltransferase
MGPFWRAGSGDPGSARAEMVERQLARRGIHEPVVLQAMGAVPREEFVPPESRSRAYADCALSIGHGQTISQPYMVAAMTQALLTPRVASGGGEKIRRALEVGGGSGYQAAVLSLLAHEVITIERVAELADRARETLARLGYRNVEVVAGDGSVGLPDRAPFDAILVAAAAPRVPPALLEQLALGGRLVAPVGNRSLQELAIVRHLASGFDEERTTACVFVPLIGEQGWDG